MIPRTGSFRPKYVRRHSRTLLKSTTEHEVSPLIPHVDTFLNIYLPIEYFKQDIVKLCHDLKIPGWRLVTLEMANDLNLQRISGALTNSVYEVRAPAYVSKILKDERDVKGPGSRQPQNLLLRVYGRNVNLLIDRRKELAVVALLTSLNIGPRLFGTFANGRLEQFLNAKPLTRFDIRNSETSIQIAKRMRDLHDHVPLSDTTRLEGPEIWLSIEKWLIPALDRLGEMEEARTASAIDIFGAPAFVLKQAIHKYREWLDSQYNLENSTKLVFCHNDTQYGNILRLEPPKGSPLLQPQNEHRQLVVIDFEYSGANPRAVDIANHFCEWMSDYHHPTKSYYIWEERYPTPTEQHTFVRSYVEHGSQDLEETAMLEEEKELLLDVRNWRAAVSAFWGLWGIVQVPADEEKDVQDAYLHITDEYKLREGSPMPPDEADPAENYFNYLEYSKCKFKLFWKDLEELNVFKR